MPNPSTMSVSQIPYGLTQSGTEVTQFTCVNQHGHSIEVINYGATLTAVHTPDRNNDFANIAAGCDEIGKYESCTCYFGSIVGRVCNRLANGKFNIEGAEYSLAINDPPNHLHGGLIGFDKRVWQAEPIEDNDSVGVRLNLVSESGDEGYPGRLAVTAEYRLTNQNELHMQLRASTDQVTHVNLTGHGYWNLSGSGTILDHQLTVNAKQFLVVNKHSIPTGELSPVEGTPLDFRSPKPIGQDLHRLTNDPTGYDHCLVIDYENSPDANADLSTAAVVIDPGSGRKMEVLTNQPSVQFYTGNYLDGQPTSNGFQQHSAFCLETQGYVDAANHPHFPTTLLKPGETYCNKTVYRFSVADKTFLMA